IFVIGFAILNSRLRYEGLIPAQWLPGLIEPALLITAATAVVVLQYARRRTLRSQLLVVSAVLIAIAISTIRKQPPFSPDLYPQASAGERLPVQVSLDTELNEQRSAPFEKNKVPVWIPLLVSGIASDGAASLDGAMVDIEAAGMSWNSGWFRTYQYFLPIQGKSQFMFVVDKSFFEHVKTAPATLHISLALTGFRAQAVRRLVASAGDFEVPGEAI